MLKRPLGDKFPTNQKSGEEGGGGGRLELWDSPSQVTTTGDGALEEAEPLPGMGRTEGTPHLALLVCAAAFLSLLNCLQFKPRVFTLSPF